MQPSPRRGSASVAVLLGVIALIGALAPAATASHSTPARTAYRGHLCHGHRPTIRGTAGSDFLVGTVDAFVDVPD